jgi:hypothetical protein
MILDQRKFSLRRSGEIFRKNYIFQKIFINSRNLFGLLFLHNKFISETNL